MSEWITGRRPTEEDAHESALAGYVWVTTEHGIVLRQQWHQVSDRPWMPITYPKPYVKPKRWRVSIAEVGFLVYDAKFGVYIQVPLPTREAAQRIAAIYEEVMP